MLLPRFREGLKIDTRGGKRSVLALVFFHDGVRLGKHLFKRLFATRHGGIPPPRKAPKNLDTPRTGAFDDFFGVDGRKVIPNNRLVEFEQRHVLEKTLEIVDTMPPSPNGAFANGGRALCTKLAHLTTERRREIPLVANVVFFRKRRFVKIYAEQIDRAVQYARLLFGGDDDCLIFG